MKILFVGSNPSQSAASVTPFWQGTKSAKVLANWLESLQANMGSDIDQVHFANVSPNPTPNNRPLKTSEIKANMMRLRNVIEMYGKDIKLIALGKTAEKALRLLNVEFFSMPHPSGRNRLLNDPTFIEGKIKDLSLWLRSHKY